MSETKPPKDAKSMVAVEQLARAGLCPRCYEQVEQGRCPRCFEMQDVGQEPAGEGE